MSNERAQPGLDSLQQLESLTARLAVDEADIENLKGRADASDRRADAIEAQSDEDRQAVDTLATRVDVDEEVIAQLVADGALDREHAAHLEVALRTSRKIGAALGIVMATHKISEDAAFEVLKKVSQDTNRKVQLIAEDLVRTGDVSGLLSDSGSRVHAAPLPS